jgi:hypothetical protein
MAMQTPRMAIPILAFDQDLTYGEQEGAKRRRPAATHRD